MALGVATATSTQAGISATSTAEPTTAALPGAPNILFVITDDQRLEDALLSMPKTARFFRGGGTAYTNAFATTPLCCPSRGSIFSGRYSHNHGVLTNGATAAAKSFDKGATLQRQLRAAGYRTAIFGKYFNAWPLNVNPLNWDRWSIFKHGYTDVTFNHQGVMQQRTGYSTDLISNDAVQALRAFESTDSKPWFLVVAPAAPHAPFTPRSDDVAAPVASWSPNPAVYEKDRTDKPAWVQSWGYGVEKGRTVRDQQQRTLMSVDDMVGRLAGMLGTLGEQNTLAFFISDNGMLLGEHKLGGAKRFPYNESVEVPLFMRWPGQVPAGAVREDLVGNVDLMPTVLEATGVAPDATVPIDGRSLLSSAPRTRIHLEYAKSPEAPAVPSWASTRTEVSQYIEWYDDQGNLTFREYYDQQADPWQLTNLFRDGDPLNDPPVAVLSEALQADRACVGAACP